MRAFSVRKVAGDGKSLFWSLPILLENVSYYCVFRYLIADAETLLCYAEYNY
jgi:hypothetical protein